MSLILGSALRVRPSNCTVIPLENLRCAIVFAVQRVPKIVHANQHTEQVRQQRQAIRVPSVGELEHFVAADAAIVDLDAFCLPINEKFSRGEPSITVTQPQLIVRVCLILPAAASIRDESPWKTIVSFWPTICWRSAGQASAAKVVERAAVLKPVALRSSPVFDRKERRFTMFFASIGVAIRLPRA